MSEFINAVSSSNLYIKNRVRGYSEYEIKCIESLYDIYVSGQLLSFLKQIGRCAGNVIGDDQLIFYSNRSVRQQVLLQNAFYEDFIRCRMTGYRNFFLIGISGYKIYAMLKTASEEPDNIYLFHEETCELEQTGQTLLEFVDDCVKAEYRTWSAHQSNPISFQGDLITFG